MVEDIATKPEGMDAEFSLILPFGLLKTGEIPDAESSFDNWELCTGTLGIGTKLQGFSQKTPQ